MDLRGLSAGISVADSFARADKAAANELALRAAVKKEQAQTAISGIMQEYAAGNLTLEDAGNMVMGFDPDMGLEMRQKAQADRTAKSEKRIKAIDDIAEGTKGLDNEESYQAYRELAREKYGNMLDVDSILPEDYETFSEVKGAWTGEAVAMSGLAKKQNEYDQLKSRYGAEDPRTVAARTELDRAEEAYVKKAEAADLELQRKRQLLEQGPDRDRKERDVHLGDNVYQKQESYDDGRTWQNVGEPLDKNATKRDRAPGDATEFTKAQRDMITRAVDADEDLNGLDNKDLLIDAVLTEANHRGKSDQKGRNYQEIIQEVMEEVKATSVTPAEESPWWNPFDWDEPAKYEPKSFVTEERAVERGYEMQINRATGEKRAKVGGRWVPVQ